MANVPGHLFNMKMKKPLLRGLIHQESFFFALGACAMLVAKATTSMSFIAGVFGVLKSIFWTNAPKWLSCLLYGVVIFLFMPYLSEFNQGLGFFNMVLIWAGCIVYGIGAMFYAFKRPDFFPEVFGHHELFHLFTVIGAILHFIVMYRLIN